MNEVINQIGKYRIVPVVVIEQPKNAMLLGKAVIAGGLPILEITLRTAAAVEIISILADNLPKLLIGAGTVLSVEQVKIAVNAGAKFIVAPGFNPKVVDYCIEREVPVIPGISNPTLIEMALERHLKVVKFFPAEALGGVNYLKAIASPYSDIKFVPTGGICQNNLSEYLAYERVFACGGSWMVSKKLINENRFSEITKLTQEACAIAQKES